MTTKRRMRRQARPTDKRKAPRSKLRNLWHWRAANPQIFPTDTSLRWHMRQHGDAYFASGAVLEIGGRFVCDPELMERTMREVGARLAGEPAAAAVPAVAAVPTAVAMPATENQGRDE